MIGITSSYSLYLTFSFISQINIHNISHDDPESMNFNVKIKMMAFSFDTGSDSNISSLVYLYEPKKNIFPPAATKS